MPSPCGPVEPSIVRKPKCTQGWLFQTSLDFQKKGKQFETTPFVSVFPKLYVGDFLHILCGADPGSKPPPPTPLPLPLKYEE